MLPVFWTVMVYCRTSPGSVVPPSISVTIFCAPRIGAATIGVLSLPVALMPVLLSATAAVLSICATPLDSGLFTLTAKAADPLPPAPDTAPIVRVQLVPAGLPLAQLQPAALAPASNLLPLAP